MPMHGSGPTLSLSCCPQAVSGREGVVQVISVVEARVVALLTGKRAAGGRELRAQLYWPSLSMRCAGEQ